MSNKRKEKNKHINYPYFCVSENSHSRLFCNNENSHFYFLFYINGIQDWFSKTTIFVWLAVNAFL